MLSTIAIRRFRTGRGILSQGVLLRVVVMMVVMVPFPGVIHMLITDPPVRVLILKGIRVRPAQLH